MNSSITRATPASRIAGVLALVLIVVLLAAPWWGSTATLRLIGEMMVYLALASLWNLLAGYTGLVSVGQQAYVGLGVYIMVSVTIYLGIHPYFAIPLAGLVAVLDLFAGRQTGVPPAGRLFRHWHLGGGGSVPSDCGATRIGRPGRRFRHLHSDACDAGPGSQQVLARGVDLLDHAGARCRRIGAGLWPAALAHRPGADRDPRQRSRVIQPWHQYRRASSMLSMSPSPA